MASQHDPQHDSNQSNIVYFTQPRPTENPYPLPPGYEWEEQVHKYCRTGLLGRIGEINFTSSDADYQFYRTGLDSYGQPRKTASNFNRLSGVFCHRGLYDRAMKISENTELAIDKGLGLGLRLHELDVRLHTRSDKSINTRKAFLAHDATGARVTSIARRWSQVDGADFIGTIIVERGINLETNKYASSYQETMARIPGLAKLLSDYDPSDPWKKKNDGVALREFFENSTFQLDLRDKDFAPMLAWLRYRHFFNLDIILKGYNYCYSNGQAILNAVNSFGTTDNGSLIEVLEGHDAAVTSVASHYRSMQIASGSHDSTVRIWEADTGKLIRTLNGHENTVTSVVFSGNVKCKWLLSGSCDKTIRIWGYETGTLIRTIRGHEEAVTSVAFSDHRKWIVSGSDDKTARIWDAETGQLLQELNHWEPVTSVAFSNDEMLVASGSHENTVRIWAAESGRLYHILKGHTGPVTSLAFSGDCTQIASGSHDNTVRIWEVNTGKLLYTLEGHTKQVNSVVFSNDSMQVASGSDDETVRIWTANTGELDYVLRGHTKPVTSVVFGHGRGHGQIFTASRDRTIQIWGQRPAWDKNIKTSFNMRIIIVFMSQPIINIALKRKGAKFEDTNADERLELLDYDFLYDTTVKHITSFIETPIPRYGQIIPEIVHSGLGLGYDMSEKAAHVNPKDYSRITEAGIILASRIDRAMIEVSLKLRQKYPQMVFSSCTRLSDVYIKDAEYSAGIQNGQLYKKAVGEQGIERKLRALHGGLYPPSDIVIADDPFAEIAARTWIDEYAKLDRSQLLTMSYDDWLGQDPEVKDAVDELNKKFPPNTISEPTQGVGTNEEQEQETEQILPSSDGGTDGDNNEGDNGDSNIDKNIHGGDASLSQDVKNEDKRDKVTEAKDGGGGEHEERDHKDSDQKDSDHEDSDQEDSDQEDNDQEDSDHEDSDQEDSDQEDSDQEDSGHEDSDHEDSDHEDSDQEDSDHEDSNQEDSDHEDSDHEDSDHEDSGHEDSDHSESEHGEIEDEQSEDEESSDDENTHHDQPRHPTRGTPTLRV
ncbi:hypothetical protein N7536_007116 [Penicillium majusculum]|uniref:Uncharacterized protein n=1 Tax=Penicillium solitum TaxID=60172 RepID=A0A1V6RLT2_9EURO|nr:uncharacterized protein PENSOL_c002G03565 [Penicillium solitum]KAJ5696704.1 hypothetical protein N7536_007116 [Penicillium majusculum]OQE02490.1 hypothetical protein PENSOL_c002G03565 [Penicillium solitum]